MDCPFFQKSCDHGKIGLELKDCTMWDSSYGCLLAAQIRQTIKGIDSSSEQNLPKGEFLLPPDLIEKLQRFSEESK